MKSTVAQALAGALGYIYLEPLAEERGRRRLRDLQARGERRSLAAVTADIRQRDLQDSTRDVAPLRPAHDAVRIDSTALDVGEVVGAMLDVVRAGPA
ncbi:(d)CMP kinase [Myxococcota bacterium]|nr:(d)CMP kinase [Myxococcota bacterium]